MRSRLPDLVVGLLLMLATLIVYAPAYRNGFVYFDDDDYVTDNPHVLTGLSPTNTWWALTTNHAANWHPLTWLSLQLDSQLVPPTAKDGPNPTVYIATNVLLHAVNTLLLFLVLRGMTGYLGRSAFVAACFAVHPLHVESVAWIAERKDVLSGLFWMLTLLAYLRYVERPSLARYLLIVLAFTLGLMSKPMLVTLPFVLLLLDYWPLARFPAIREKIPLFALSALACGVTWYAQHQGRAVADTTWFPLSARLANALVSYCTYLGKTIWPTHLVAFYPHPRDNFLLWQVAAAGLFLALATTVVIILRKRWPYLGVGWFWYLGTLVPVIGLVQVGGQAMADRYTYLPLIGIFVLVTWGLGDLIHRWRLQRIAVPLTALLLVTWSLYTWAQIQTWQDGFALWGHALRLDSRNPRAHLNLGTAFLHHNQVAEAIAQFQEAMRIDPQDSLAAGNLGAAYIRHGQPQAAIDCLSALLDRYPDISQAHVNLGTAYEATGNLDEAIHHYAEATRCGGPDAGVSRKWGAALERRGDLDEAIRHYREGLVLDPKDARAWQYLGHALARQEQWPDAADASRRALELDPQNVRAHITLAESYIRLGLREGGRQQYEEASKIDPQWPERANAKAWMQATDPDPHQRDGRNALLLAQETCQATDHREPRFLDTLAAAYAEVGAFDKAIATAKQALGLTASSGASALSQAIESRMAGYQRKEAFRTSK